MADSGAQRAATNSQNLNSSNNEVESEDDNKAGQRATPSPGGACQTPSYNNGPNTKLDLTLRNYENKKQEK